jgi:hypothetical protein
VHRKCIPIYVYIQQHATLHSLFMLLRSIAHSIICTRLFRGKMHSDWFNGIDVLQGRWQHGEKVGYCYPSRLEKTLFKWEVYVPLVTKGLTSSNWQLFSATDIPLALENRKTSRAESSDYRSSQATKFNCCIYPVCCGT